MEAKAPGEAEATGFVVAEPGWWFLVRPGAEPQPCRLEDLLEIVGPGPDRDEPAPPLPSSSVLRPRWSWVARLEGAHLTVEDPAGRRQQIHAEDLRLLDRIGRGSASALSSVPPSSMGRLTRLVSIGLLTVEQPEEAAATEPDAGVRPARDSTPTPSPADGRIPVYAPWHPSIGPCLALGMLTASARAHPGIVESFEIRRPEDADTVLRTIGARPPGPAILLCSDYVWSVDANLDLARRALEHNPELLVIHGGPSAPAYPGDAASFLRSHGSAARLLCRGEGEHQIGPLLDALRDTLPRLDPERLVQLPGLTFLDPGTGTLVRTPDPERIADLDRLPSPYLTGEFDHIESAAWHYALTVETNRGCPYGCTFCDWGSSTLSRIRKFSIDRVEAEIEWSARRGVTAVTLADANFGILPRDVEVAERIAAIKARSGYPGWVSFTPAKNTTRHLVPIMEVFRDVGIVPSMSISLQTIDEKILAAIDRTNISTDHYLSLAADHRRHGHPLQSDVLLGVPEQTFETYRRDLQFNIDHEILARTWPVQLLPNSPMNEPAYRERYGIEADANGIVRTTSTYDEADRERMYDLRRAYVTLDVFGLLRHVLKWVQWDQGIDATTVMVSMLEVVDREADAAPHLAFVLANFDRFPAPPSSWSSFYDEVGEILVERLGVSEGPELETVLKLNRFLMPAVGREFPASIHLEHDYLAYYRAGARHLYDTGHAGTPPAPLGSYGPASFTVWSDPLDLCNVGPQLHQGRVEGVLQSDFYMAATSAYELHSPLTRLLPRMARALTVAECRELVAPFVGTDPTRSSEARWGTPVGLSRARSLAPRAS